jgi:hypothetical protein
MFSITSQIKLPIVVSEFEAHDKLKRQLLEAIKATKSSTVNEDNYGEVISRTDWRVNPNRDGEGYFHILKPFLDEHLREVYSKLHYTEFQYSGVWFQQYNKLDQHSWHRHGRTHWTNVYYLELPQGSPGTTILDPFDNVTEHTPQVYEGYILTAPAMLMHCSKPNISSKRKTVIAFNIW